MGMMQWVTREKAFLRKSLVQRTENLSPFCLSLLPPQGQIDERIDLCSPIVMSLADPTQKVEKLYTQTVKRHSHASRATLSERTGFKNKLPIIWFIHKSKMSLLGSTKEK